MDMSTALIAFTGSDVLAALLTSMSRRDAELPDHAAAADTVSGEAPCASHCHWRDEVQCEQSDPNAKMNATHIGATMAPQATLRTDQALSDSDEAAPPHSARSVARSGRESEEGGKTE
jgi:hypothetical protein